MSFNDLESGLSSPVRGARELLPNETLLRAVDASYREITERVSSHVLTITGNIAKIQRRIERLGEHGDVKTSHEQLHSLLEETHQLVRETSADIKRLGSYSGATPQQTQQRRLEQQKLSRDFQVIIAQFQNTQRFAAEKSRSLMDRARAREQSASLLSSSDTALDVDATEDQPLLGEVEQRIRIHQALDNEIDYNDNLIQERDAEIREMQQGITELNEIFRDLGTIVTEQQALLDNIEHNVGSVALSTHRGAEELSTASRYQRRGRKLKCYLLLVLSIILAFVIILVFVL